MFNKKTTLIGYAVILGAVIDFIVSWVNTGGPSPDLWRDVVAAAGGAGLINAKDGSH
ncbi:MAG: hypothetical protein ACE5JU_25795 [Candidatus Binatia bacterium]